MEEESVRHPGSSPATNPARLAPAILRLPDHSGSPQLKGPGNTRLPESVSREGPVDLA